MGILNKQWAVFFSNSSSAINDSSMISKARIFSQYLRSWMIHLFFLWTVYFQRRDRIFLTFEECIFKPTVYFKPRTVYFQLKDRFFQPWLYILRLTHWYNFTMLKYIIEVFQGKLWFLILNKTKPWLLLSSISMIS